MTTSSPLLRTWLPTALGSSMLVVEIPLVSAFVARAPDGAAALAAFGICIAVIVVVNSPALALAPLVVGMPRSVSVRRYTVLLGLGAALVCAALAVTPLPAVLFGTSEQVADGVRNGLLALAPASPAVALRRYLHGLLISADRTGGITVATVSRLVASALAAVLATELLPTWGAGAGCFALTVGAFAETAVLSRLWMGGPLSAEPVSTRRLLRAHLPLSGARLLNMAPQVITILAVGHAVQAAASLTVWPTVYGLLALFTTPTADLESVVGARHTDRPAATRRLAWQVGVGFTAAFAVVVCTPLAAWYVEGFVGVPSAPAELGLLWIFVLLPAPVLWVVRSYYRGMVVAHHDAPRLLVPIGAHVAVLVALSVALPFTGLPGVACAGLALVGGLAAETVWSGRVSRLDQPAARCTCR